MSSTAPLPSIDAGSVDASAEDAGGPGAPKGPTWTWIEAVRHERWAEAAPLIDALPEATRDRPEMRYVRARAAIGAGDAARALALLEGLEEKVPLLTQDIARFRAEAQLSAGPYVAAAAYFIRSGRSRDLARAASAYEKAGNPAAARASADRAIQVAARAKSTRDEATARITRATIAKSQGQSMVALADYRWVTDHAAGSAEASAAADGIHRLKHPPMPKDRPATPSKPSETPKAPEPAKPLEPAKSSEPARPPEPAKPLEPARSSEPAKAAEPAPPPPPPRINPPPPRIERMAMEIVGAPRSGGPSRHARAMSLYRAREYLEAARVFREAAASGSGHEAEDLFYAGRSLARADRDDDAVEAYRQGIARYPRSVFAERSAYFAARVELQRGRYTEAATAFSSYLAAYPRGGHRDEAEYERAISLLSAGSAEEARQALSGLAGRARSDKAFRLRELEGVAADRAGDRAGAIAIWSAIVRSEPLTWAAVASRARLATTGAPIPVSAPPASGAAAPSPLDLRLPATPALLASLGLDEDAESSIGASERVATAPYAGREREALCGLYGLISRAKRRYQVGRALGDLFTGTPSAAERWAWDCMYPQPFSFGVRALEDQLALPRGLVHAVMRQESSFDPAAFSPASAVGLMQIMPATATQAASELAMPFDAIDLARPDVNLRLGAFYLGKLLTMFRGNVVVAAAAYNAGPRAASHWIEVGADNDVDVWVARIPFDETRNYVARVAQNLARYQWLMGGEGAVTAPPLSIPSDARAPVDAY